MERLTKWNEQTEQAELLSWDEEEWKDFMGSLDVPIATELSFAINKLAAYEDAEEQGLLIRVPSRKVWESSGDAVYYIYDYEIVECINCGISVDCEGNIWIALACDEDIFPYRTPIPEIDTSFEDWCKNSTDVKIEEWGKTVFLTREEAESALAEMEGGEDFEFC